jgi:hypothetical protein
VAIEKWERSQEPPKRESVISSNAIPHRTTLWAERRFQMLSGGAVVIAALAAFLGAAARLPEPICAIFLASALTAGILAALDYRQAHTPMSAFHLRIAADAAMLTPLLFVFVLR